MDEMIISFHLSQTPWQERMTRLEMDAVEIEKRMIKLHKKDPFLTDYHLTLLKNKHKK